MPVWELVPRRDFRLWSGAFYVRSFTRTWLLIAYSDERWLYYQFSLPHSYLSLYKVGRMHFLNLRVRGLNVWFKAFSTPIALYQVWDPLRRAGGCQAASQNGRRFGRSAVNTQWAGAAGISLSVSSRLFVFNCITNINQKERCILVTLHWRSIGRNYCFWPRIGMGCKYLFHGVVAHFTIAKTHSHSCQSLPRKNDDLLPDFMSTYWGKRLLFWPRIGMGCKYLFHGVVARFTIAKSAFVSMATQQKW